MSDRDDYPGNCLIHDCSRNYDSSVGIWYCPDCEREHEDKMRAERERTKPEPPTAPSEKEEAEMSEQRIGTCSICFGDVVGFRGGGDIHIQTPPARCTSCGATERSDIIEMHPVKGSQTQIVTSSTINLPTAPSEKEEGE